MLSAKPFNPETGVELTATSKIEDLSDALKFFRMKSAEFASITEDIIQWLKPHYFQAVEAGEDKFLDYWSIRRGSRRFDKKKFTAEADEDLKSRYDLLKAEIVAIEEDYKTQSDPILAFPRIA